MSEKIDTTITLLTKFGLSELEARIYLDIYTGKGDTALAISRETKLARTKVYRILDTLLSKKMIITRIGERGMRFVAINPNQLEFLVSDKEYELQNLKQNFPLLQTELAKLSTSPSKKQSQVLYYHGIDGLKQVTYNSLRTNGELLTYELSTMNAFINQTEAEELRERFVANQIKIRTLTNVTKIDAYTNVTNLVTKYWDIRHIDPTDNPFKFEILIYNDVYCMYRYVDEEIFCVEIHNQELTDMQRQLFEIIWSNAKKFKVLDDHGAAELL